MPRRLRAAVLERIEAKRLPVSTAFHSPLVQGACAPLREFLESIPTGTPRVPLFSNRTGQRHRLASQTEPDGSKVQDEVASAIAEPVLFVEQLEAMYAAGARVFVEVGPGSVLTRLVGRCLGERPHLAVELEAPGKHGVQALLEGLARLSVAGVPLDLQALREGEAPVEDPASTPKSKLTLRLCGANYQKPVLPDAVPQPVKTQKTTTVGPTQVQPVTPPVAPVPATTLSGSASSPSSRSALPPAAPVVSPAPVSTPLPSVPFSADASVGPAAVSSAVHASRPGARPVPASYATPTSASALSAPPTALATLITAQMEYERLMAESHTAFLQAMAATSLGVSQPFVGPTVASNQALPAALSPARMEPPPVPAVRLDGPGWMAPPPTPPPPVPAVRLDGPEWMAPPPTPPPPAPIKTPEPPVAPAPTSRPAPERDLVGLMLSVVAEKTGYPAEMIELTMDLESDLGIDSIKRVEILSAVRTRAPGLPELDTARMSRMRTLQEILAFLSGASQPTARPFESTPALGPVTSSQDRAGNSTAPSEVEEQPVGRQVARAVAAPPAGLAVPGVLTGGEVVLTPDGNGIAEALAARLRGRGTRVKVADQPSEETSAFIYLGGLRNINTIADALAVNQQAFSAARSVAARFGQQGGTLVMVQDTGGAFGLEGELWERAWLAGLAGLARTAGEEWPLACVRTIDLEKGGRESDAIAAELEKELLFGGPELEVGLRADGTRLTLIDVAAPELAPSRSIPNPA